MITMWKIIITVSGFALLLLACGKDTVDYNADCSTPKSFANDVSAIIQSTCAINAGCHGSGCKWNYAAKWNPVKCTKKFDHLLDR